MPGARLASGEPGAEKGGGDRQNKQNADGKGIQPQHAAQQHAAARFENRNARQRADQQHNKAYKAGIAQQSLIAAEKRRDFAALRTRLRQPAHHRAGHCDAEQQQESETGVPAEQLRQQRADNRRQQRTDQQAHIEQAISLTQRDARIEVARHSTRHHARHAGAQPLNGAAQHQHVQRRRKHRGHGADHKDRHAGEDHRAAPDAVGERAVDQLRSAIGHQIGRHHALQRAVVHVERVRHLGHRRDIDRLRHLPNRQH